MSSYRTSDRGTPSRPTRRQLRARPVRPGFSLIEMLTVFVILGVILTMAMPRIDLPRQKGDQAALLVRSVFQLAQRSALTRQHDMIVSFDTVGHRVRLAEDRDNDRAIDPGEIIRFYPLANGNKFASPAKRLTEDPGTTSSISGPSIKPFNAMPSVVFRRDGFASTDAYIYIRVVNTKMDDMRAVSVRQSTGRPDWWRKRGSDIWVMAK